MRGNRHVPYLRRVNAKPLTPLPDSLYIRDPLAYLTFPTSASSHLRITKQMSEYINDEANGMSTDYATVTQVAILI